MSIISKFVRELEPYSKDKLKNEIFNTTEEKTVALIKKLKEYGVLKQCPKTKSTEDLSELATTDVFDVVEDSDITFFVFTFVGILCVNGVVLICYPKYISSNAEPIEELNQVIKVIKKYNSKEETIRMYNGDGDKSSFNLLAVMLYLMNDYYEYGLYNNYMQIVEENGMGEILWDKTINETFSIIKNNRPYYTSLKTNKTVVNDYDFFQRLHATILSSISKEFQAAKLLDVFEFDEECIYLSEENLEDFGDADYLLYRIEQELNVQFNTHKQLVLKTLYAYISSGKTLEDIDSFSLFGTNSFNLVWERVCADILDNKLHTKLKDISLPSGELSKEDGNKELIKIIDKPEWCAYGADNEIFGPYMTNTLEPDIVSIHNGEFLIFDAKYYNIELNENGVKKQPGLESITKQYLYQLAYKDFIKEHSFSNVRNCFLFPTEKDITIVNGFVKMKIFEDMELSRIEVRLLSARRAYNLYLKNDKMPLSEISL